MYIFEELPVSLSPELAIAAQILTTCRTIAVVGLSDKPHRDSYHVAAYLQSQGYRVIPINPSITQVLGEKAYPSLSAAARHETIELVDCFRNSAEIAPLVEQAIAIGARAVWMQLGVEHPAAAAQAQAAGLLVVQNRCPKIDLPRLLAQGSVPARPGPGTAV